MIHTENRPGPRPQGGPGKRVGRTNEFAGFKAEINSTFSLLYGVVSVTVSANTVKGTITNLALIGERAWRRPSTALHRV